MRCLQQTAQPARKPCARSLTQVLLAGSCQIWCIAANQLCRSLCHRLLHRQRPLATLALGLARRQRRGGQRRPALARPRRPPRRLLLLLLPLLRCRCCQAAGCFGHPQLSQHLLVAPDALQALQQSAWKTHCRLVSDGTREQSLVPACCNADTRQNGRDVPASKSCTANVATLHTCRSYSFSTESDSGRLPARVAPGARPRCTSTSTRVRRLRCSCCCCWLRCCWRCWLCCRCVPACGTGGCAAAPPALNSASSSLSEDASASTTAATAAAAPRRRLAGGEAAPHASATGADAASLGADADVAVFCPDTAAHAAAAAAATAAACTAPPTACRPAERRRLRSPTSAGVSRLGSSFWASSRPASRWETRARGLRAERGPRTAGGAPPSCSCSPLSAAMVRAVQVPLAMLSTAVKRQAPIALCFCAGAHQAGSHAGVRRSMAVGGT